MTHIIDFFFYSHDCIERCLLQSSECPVCKVPLPPNVKRLTPNFACKITVKRTSSLLYNYIYNGYTMPHS